MGGELADDLVARKEKLMAALKVAKLVEEME